jgi:translation initiation factor IF-1
MPKTYGGKKSQARQRTNLIRSRTAMVDESAVFARVIKALGNSRFRILCPDAKGKTTVEVDARIGGNSVARISVGDIAIVGRNTSADRETYEILGSLDRKQIKDLEKARRLHPTLMETEADGGDGIEFTYDEGDEKKSEEDEEVNVDAI